MALRAYKGETGRVRTGVRSASSGVPGTLIGIVPGIGGLQGRRTNSLSGTVPGHAIFTANMVGATTGQLVGRVTGQAGFTSNLTTGSALPSPVGLIALGDSRIANGFSQSTSGATYNIGVISANGYAGWLMSGISNKALTSYYANFGVGSSTSQSMVNRVSSSNIYNGTTVITAFAGTGNGTIAVSTNTSGIWTGTATQVGNYLVTFTSATAFTVTDPLGATVGSGTAGTNFNSSQVNLKVTVGGTAFVAGDHFTITCYGPQNPAYAITAGVTDMQWNLNSTGEYSPVSAPDNIVFIMDGTNDGITVANTITNISATLDALTAANKVVFLANETPKGVAFAQLESHAVSGSAATATNAANFLQDGSDFGTAGVINAATGAVYTKVGSAPAIGQYSVSAGVYSFNASDTATTVYLNYSYKALGPTSQNQLDRHLWLSSSASNFVASGTGGSGTNYGVPGALYNRPLVRSVDSWGAILDPATNSGAAGTLGNYQNLPGTLTDGLHPNTYGGQLVRNAFAAAFNAAYPSATDQSRKPTTNNYYFGLGNGATTTFTTTWPNATSGAIVAGTLSVRAAAVVGTDNGLGTISGSGISGTVNYATGAISVTFTAAPASNIRVVASTDTTNVVANGLFDPNMTQGQSAPPANVTGLSFLPAPWTMAVDANTTTNLASGAVTIALSNTTSDAGYPELTITIAGHATNSGTITLSDVLNNWANLINTSTPDKLRAGVVAKIMPNGGRLIGLLGAQAKLLFQSSANLTRPVGSPLNTGASTTFTLVSATSLSSVIGIPMSDLDLTLPGQSSGFTVSGLSPQQSTAGITITGSPLLQVLVAWAAGPVSAIVKLSQAQLRIRSD